MSVKSILDHGDFGLGAFANLDGATSARLHRDDARLLLLFSRHDFVQGDWLVRCIPRARIANRYCPRVVAPIMKKAFDTPGPVIVGVHVDYSGVWSVA